MIHFYFHSFVIIKTMPLLASNQHIFKDRLFSILYSSLKSLLPIFIFIFAVVLKFPILAYIIILLSKWRIFLVHPNFWWHNFRLNSVDLIISLSIVHFMSWANLNLAQQLLWLGFYLAWILYLKTLKRHWGRSIQSLLAQGLGLSVIVYNIDSLGLPIALLATWLIAIFSIRHLLGNFLDRNQSESLVYIWAISSIQLTWVLLHWQLHFWIIPRLVLIQTVLLIMLGLLIHLSHSKLLNSFLTKQIIISGSIIILVALLLSSFHTVAI